MSDSEDDLNLYDLDHAPGLPADYSLHLSSGSPPRPPALRRRAQSDDTRLRFYSSGSASDFGPSGLPRADQKSRVSFARKGFSMLGLTSNHSYGETRSNSREDDGSIHTLPSRLKSRGEVDHDVDDELDSCEAGNTKQNNAVDSLCDDSLDGIELHAHTNHDDPNSAEGELEFVGLRLPRWLSKRRPSWNRVAACIVSKAPCFWCFSFQHKTDRAVLQRLNILCALISVARLVSSLWLFSVLLSSHNNSKPLGGSETTGDGGTAIELLSTVWNVNGNIVLQGILALLILLASLITVPVIRSVNLVGAIRYLWALLWIAPFEIFNVIGLFDYFGVTQVWIRHWWRDGTLSWFRERFCDPSHTADTTCAAPVARNVADWCVQNFNSTSCGSIRSNAQSNMEAFMLTYYYINAAVGIILIILLLLVINTLESILSRPLVQKARQSNVPAWFSLPIVGSITVGSLYAFSNTSVLATSSGSDRASWIGPLYIVTGVLFFLAAVLGWFIHTFSIMNTRDKQYKLAAIHLFMVLTATIFVMLVTLFAGSIGFSLSIVDIPLRRDERGNIACFIDRARTCTRCDLTINRCPEWTTGDVTSVLQTQAKNSAALASIFLIYAFSAIRFGFSMRKDIMLYEIDFV